MSEFKNPNKRGRKPEKHWRDAIMRAVRRRQGKAGEQWLEILADKLVAIANAGDVSAMKEIGDRLDGKPAQQVNLANDTGDGPAEIRVVQSVIVDPKNSNG